MTEQIVELRKSGLTCKQTAEKLGIREWDVWNAMRRTGLDGEIRNYSHIRRRPVNIASPRHPVEKTLDEFDVITVERGACGGFIVTLDERWTGVEADRLREAIDSAKSVAEGV